MRKNNVTLRSATMIAALSGALFTISGCGSKEGSKANPGDELSHKEIMVSQVDQNADLLWDAVSSKSDATGVHVQKPETAEDWGKLENAAVGISSAMDLLLKERPVVPEGLEVADADKPGALNARAIKAIIDADRPAFEAHALELKGVAERMRNAARSRNANTLMELGGELDDACEACHKQFWYPDPKKPTGNAGR